MNNDTSDLDKLNLNNAARAHCAALPPMCLTFVACNAPGQRIVVIRRGEPGCYQTTLDYPKLSIVQAKAIVDAYNGKLGVRPSEKAAMLCGSMFGGDAPGADWTRYPRLDPLPPAGPATPGWTRHPPCAARWVPHRPRFTKGERR